MEGVNMLLLVTNSAGVAADAAQEFVSVYLSHIVQLGVWEISSRKNIVADRAL